MRPLLDDAEKHHLAAGEPLLAHSENVGNAGRLEHRRARLAAFELDHEVLVAPDRHKEAAGIGNPFEDPLGIAAAQAGALEAGMRIEIRRPHSRTLSQPPDRGKAALQIGPLDIVRHPRFRQSVARPLKAIARRLTWE